jgi:hypothetical protein
MAVQTPIASSLYDVVMGNLRMEVAKFASIANADTFNSGLSTIVGFSFDGGSSAPTTGATWVNGANGATVTFLVTTGPAVNASLVLWGF